MFIKYKDETYKLIRNILFEQKLIITHNTEKTDDSFFALSDYYAKICEMGDKNIKNIYEIDFYVGYHDTSETVKDAEKYAYEGSGMIEEAQRAVKDGIWCVNEGIPLHRSPILEDNELGLSLNHVSCSEDWIQYDRSFCSKIIDLYDCSEYIVRYTYSFKDGVQLPEAEVVEVKMAAEAFKEEMLKYRIGNI